MTDPNREAFRDFLAQHVYFGSINGNYTKFVSGCWCQWSQLATTRSESYALWATHVVERWEQK